MTHPIDDESERGGLPRPHGKKDRRAKWPEDDHSRFDLKISGAVIEEGPETVVDRRQVQS